MKPGRSIDMFCYALSKELGAMSMALGGVDQVVFTGGIGENDARVRAEVLACRALASSWTTPETKGASAT